MAQTNIRVNLTTVNTNLSNMQYALRGAPPPQALYLVCAKHYGYSSVRFDSCLVCDRVGAFDADGNPAWMK